MNRLYISPALLNYEDERSSGLIKGLKNLNTYFSITTETGKVNSGMLNVYKTEGIEFTNLSSEECNIVCNNLLELCKDEAVLRFTKFSQIADFLLKEKRTATITRDTKETKINLTLDIDGSGKSEISTGIGFFDHMLEQIARHANFDIELNVRGDLNVDEHHTVEDTGIVLGEAVKQAIGSKKGIKRYGFMLPMDDAVAQSAIDFGGRSALIFNCEFTREKVGEFPTELVKEFFRGFSSSSLTNVYIACKGENDHHKIESIFKVFAKALNEASRYDERNQGGLPSTKGVL